VVPNTEPLIDWARFNHDGHVRHRRHDGDDTRRLQDRIDSIMLGCADVDYGQLKMQLDSPSGEPR
jgi:hypothetical protein